MAFGSNNQLAAALYVRPDHKNQGKVTDASTSEPIPFVNVFLVGTTIGTTSDFDGNFYFETRTPADSIAASFVGYKRQAMKIRPNRYQELAFNLQPDQFQLEEVVVVAGENPADILMRKVLAAKEKIKTKTSSATNVRCITKCSSTPTTSTKS